MSVTYFDPGTVFGGSWERLPDGVFVRNAGGDAGAVGNVQGEGLPNIKGEFSHIIGWKNKQGWNGALYMVGDRYGGDFRDSGSTAEFTIGFDASRSNGIYGASAHVTPYNYCVYMWRRIS